MKRRIIALALLALLAACGRRAELKPMAGTALPPKPALAPKTPTSDNLLTPTAEARPQRSDEPLLRSEERRDDYFNIPPN